ELAALDEIAADRLSSQPALTGQVVAVLAQQHPGRGIASAIVLWRDPRLAAQQAQQRPHAAAGGLPAAAVRQEFRDSLRAEPAWRHAALFHPAAQPPHPVDHVPYRRGHIALPVQGRADPGLERSQRSRETILPDSTHDAAHGLTNTFLHDIPSSGFLPQEALKANVTHGTTKVT